MHKEKPGKNIFVSQDPFFKIHLYAYATICLHYNKFEAGEYKYLEDQAIAVMKLLKKEYHLQ